MNLIAKTLWLLTVRTTVENSYRPRLARAFLYAKMLPTEMWMTSKRKRAHYPECSKIK